jgi:iron-sulfur cluster assembly protein
MSVITVSDFALSHITELLKENDMEGYGLYLGIRGGGCSGYSYCLEFREDPEEGDDVADFNGLRVFVGPLKRDYLQGTVIDFEDTLMESGFKIRNPNAKRHCGCGESFDIDEGTGDAGASAF